MIDKLAIKKIGYDRTIEPRLDRLGFGGISPANNTSFLVSKFGPLSSTRPRKTK